MTLSNALLYETSAKESSEIYAEEQPSLGYIVCISRSKDMHLMEENSGNISSMPELLCVSTLKEAEELAREYDIEYFEPNFIAELFDEESQQESSNGWSYEAIRADYAAQIGLSGNGVRIAIIDSGIDSENIDLQQADIASGFDYVAGTPEIIDDLYHGSAVAQVIAADHNEVGITGAAAGATLVPLRCFSSGSGGGTVSMLAQAIYDAVDTYHCDVINMSWGLGTDSETLYNAIRYAYDAGVIMIASSGNVSSRFPQDSAAYPAAYDEVISVGAVDANLQIAETSLANSKVMLCAPGSRIAFTDRYGNGYYASGTSYAAPHVTAAVALIKELAPAMGPEAISDVFVQRAEDLGEEGYDRYYGHGFICLDRLIADRWSTVNHERIQGWCVNNNGCQVVCAAYSSTKRMTEVYMKSAEEPAMSFDWPAEPASSASFQLLFLDNDFIPLSVCDKY